MTADFDTLVRDTLHGLADRAPGEAAVRAALERRRWPRFALVAVAAAVLLVAVAVPVLRVGGTTGGAPPTRFAVAEPRVLPFGFDPAWLPPGLTEQGRTVDSSGNTKIRYWHTRPYDRPESAVLSLVVNTGNGVDTFGSEPVDLGPMGTGGYTEGGGFGIVRWSFDGFVLELVGHAPTVDKAALLRVARGIRKDAVTMLATSLEFGHLPAASSP
ncbi:hypothetical protein ACFQV2_33100 [Actinokineospora soli]|uniref:DUF4367 domain-containing protein n=1 Tax=Actinokineospora soli TaxID=1048753 RepID=A0ABW2TYL6_9PSEU